MSDITIPGVTSKVDTAKIIDALMDVKRVSLERMEKDVETYQEDKSYWQEINRKLSKLRDSAKDLYSFQNPFNEKIAESSNESILTATATREADEIERDIIVKQIARADRFISKSLDKGFKVEAGTYEFRVGEQYIKFSFSGGSLREFAEAINKKGEGLLKAEVIRDTKNSEIIIIESGKTGTKNKLVFLGKSLEFGLAVGMLEEAIDVSRTVDFSVSEPQKWEAPLDKNFYSISENTLTLNPGGELKIPVTPPLPLNTNMVMDVEITMRELTDEEMITEAPPPGPTIPEVGDITFEGITIKNEKSHLVLPDWEPPAPPERVEDMNVLFMGSGSTIVPLTRPEVSRETQVLHIPIGKMGNRIDALYLRNRNTHRIFEIGNISIYDPTSRGNFKPVNPVSEAQDAVIIMDGITVKRETNEIDDLIPHVTLNLKRESSEQVTLNVKRDIDSIKSSLITFIGYYNQLITTIDIFTRTNEEVIEQIDYFTDAEREEAHKKLGKLQGDVMLMQLKRTMQNLMMNPYKTSGDTQLSLLAQIGISTNTAKPGTSASIDKSRLRGYLDIDDSILTSMLTKNAGWVKDLFGMDTDRDLIIDSGIAFSIDNTIKPYTQTGGLLENKFKTYDLKIAAKEEEIREYNDYLEDYEASLKRKYANMEGMLETLEENSKALENFNKNQK
ncbi:MAG: flagellar filament capping protein FliD [Spirochaetales bacterium]|nr:flagellar filament capping protein FliD [Spirochaetales bacterium]